MAKATITVECTPPVFVPFQLSHNSVRSTAAVPVPAPTLLPVYTPSRKVRLPASAALPFTWTPPGVATAPKLANVWKAPLFEIDNPLGPSPAWFSAPANCCAFAAAFLNCTSMLQVSVGRQPASVKNCVTAPPCQPSGVQSGGPVSTRSFVPGLLRFFLL